MTNQSFILRVTVLSLLMAAGCGTSDKAAPATQAASEPDAGGTTTAAKLDELMGYDWTVDAGVESYYCVFQTLTEDLWVDTYKPISPPGTHHVTIGFGEPGPADGAYNEGDDIGGGATCTGITLGQKLAFGGLVGTDEFRTPEGIAIEIPAGKQMLLSVHISNTGSAPISGRSGIAVHRTAPVPAARQAEVIFIDNVFMNVTPGKSTSQGACMLDGDSTVFALLHHMHRTGAHMKTTALPANGTPSLLLDADYTFTEQKYQMLAPTVQLAKGDKIQVTCDYENPGTNTLTFGENTETNEMCIAAAYRYPASGDNFNCIATP
jgi:hypothetical protein